MKDVYRGREQTYLKHFLLEHYLERVGYVIGSTFGSFVYVDGFSGPWQSGDEAFEDTSFMIAIRTLRRVQEGLGRIGRSPRIECLFVEKDSKTFDALQGAIAATTDIKVKAIPGAFEDVIPEILAHVGRRFSLTFIGPTGWTGIALDRITPILCHSPGEVLINFMYDYHARFSGLAEHRDAFIEMMGGTGFEGLNEADTIALYCDRLRVAGDFKYVTSTRIKKPTAERSYFHLVYATRHVRGLEEFRVVEEKEIAEQERVRLEAKDLERIARTQQPMLFSADEVSGPRSFEEEFLGQQEKAAARLETLLESHGRISYEELLGELLVMPLVWPRAIKRLIDEQRKADRIEIEGLKDHQRTARKGCFIALKDRGD